MLGPDQKFYGVQVPTVKRNAAFARSIAQMSEYYVNHLVEFQPNGVFLLGGYSVGATIALEMSHQLIARGRQVGLLVIFDGELFHTGAEIGPWNPIYWLKLLLNVPRWVVDELVKNRTRFSNKAAERLRSAPFKARAKDFSAPHPIEKFINLDGFLPDHAAFMKTLYDNHQVYVPKSYSGRALVFAAKTQALLYLRQVRSAWTRIAPSAEVFEMSGTHVSILKTPLGLPLAEKLSEKIRETAAQSD
jgi:thioesterase domain-containing protein